MPETHNKPPGRRLSAGALSALLILLATVVTGGFYYRLVVNISADALVMPLDSTVAGLSDKPQVLVGVVSRYNPTVLYKGYQPILDYLTEVTDYHFSLKLTASYDETVAQLASGDVSVAFLASYLVNDARDQYGIEPLLCPLNAEGKPELHAVAVTREDSSLLGIEDLENKSLALPSSRSCSGNWLLDPALNRAGLSAESFTRVENFPHHHTVVFKVLRREFDAGVIKDRVAREYEGRGLRIIGVSRAYASSPIAVSPAADPAMVRAVTEALVQIDPAKAPYKRLVQEWDPEFRHGFVRSPGVGEFCSGDAGTDTAAQRKTP